MSAKNGHQQQQQGRRTPLSLSGVVAKQQFHQQQQHQHQYQKQQYQQQQSQLLAASNGNSKNKNESNAANSQKNAAAMNNASEPHKEKKQPNQNEKKQQQQNVVTEKKVEDKKSQNGIANSDKVEKSAQQQNGKEKQAEKASTSVESQKIQEENQVAAENVDKIDKTAHKKDDKKEDKKESHKQRLSLEEKKEKKTEAKAENKKVIEDEKMDISNNEEKSAPSTPSSAKKSVTNEKKATPKQTPEKSTTSSKRGGSSTPNKSEKQVTPSKKSATVLPDDIEMEPLKVDQSPIKPLAVQLLSNTPSATSTPGKTNKRAAAASKTEVPTTPEPVRTFSQISGRRSIRPMNDYTPSHFQMNAQFRESYRRINTELDVTSTTNTSLNVTVGSEVPNSSTFSFFFGRGRKRERTPPMASQSAMELQNDIETSPPKRARLEGFFSAVSSPLSLLRSRFSKASIQSSTPVKLQTKLAADDCEVQNVSGISIEEEIPIEGDKTATEDQGQVTLGQEAGLEAKSGSPLKADKEVPAEEKKMGEATVAAQVLASTKCAAEIASEEGLVESNTDDIKLTETALNTGVDAANKNKRCHIM